MVSLFEHFVVNNLPVNDSTTRFFIDTLPKRGAVLDYTNNLLIRTAVKANNFPLFIQLQTRGCDIRPTMNLAVAWKAARPDGELHRNHTRYRRSSDAKKILHHLVDVLGADISYGNHRAMNWSIRWGSIWGLRFLAERGGDFNKITLESFEIALRLSHTEAVVFVLRNSPAFQDDPNYFRVVWDNLPTDNYRGNNSILSFIELSTLFPNLTPTNLVAKLVNHITRFIHPDTDEARQRMFRRHIPVFKTLVFQAMPLVTSLDDFDLLMTMFQELHNMLPDMFRTRGDVTFVSKMMKELDYLQ